MKKEGGVEKRREEEKRQEKEGGEWGQGGEAGLVRRPSFSLSVLLRYNEHMTLYKAKVYKAI